MMNNEETVQQDRPKLGEVFNCKRLNIRKRPNKESEVICVVSAGDILELNAISTDGWARVYTEQGIKGYAMKKFIKES
jgi:uncharacterized protein YgiM (DUF1202 family)